MSIIIPGLIAGSFVLILAFFGLLRIVQIWVDTDKEIPRIGKITFATPKQLGYAAMLTLEVIFLMGVIYWVAARA